MRKPLLSVLQLLMLYTLSNSAQGLDPLRAIEILDVPRYMGGWYEIAKFPNWFQRSCVGDTSAEYNLKRDGTIHVVNRCRKQNGEFKQAIGSARQIGGPTSSQLKVRFAPEWLSFLPFVWGDYWVVDLDANYQVVAVSEPEREYLWILSRTPQIDPSVYEALLQRLAAMGFDPSKLELTNQRH